MAIVTLRNSRTLSTALGTAVAVTRLAFTTSIKSTSRATTGGGESAEHDLRRGALAVGFAAVLVNWDLDVQLLESSGEVGGHTGRSS